MECKIKTLILALFFTSFAYASLHENFGTHVTLSGFYGSKQQSYGELDALIPLLQSASSLFFLDIRGNKREQAGWEENIGLGFRHIGKEQWLMGAYGFLDSRRTPVGNHFNQVTLGGELRSVEWSFLGNGYLPLTHAINTRSFQTSQLSNSTNALGFYNIYYNNGIEKALPGIDVQVGHTVPFVPGLTAYVGGYYFKSSEVPMMRGPIARMTYDFADSPLPTPTGKFLENIRAEASIRKDSVVGTVYYTGLRFAMNFGGTPREDLTPVQRYMTDYVYRDLDIATGNDKNLNTNLLTHADGTPVTVALVNNSVSLQNSITNNADVIAVRGTISNLNTVTLNNDQTLTGGSYEFLPDREIQVGNNGHLIANVGQNLIQVGHNNTIRDITLTVNKNAGVLPNVIQNDQAHSVGNLTIDNVTMNAGIAFQVSDNTTDSNINIINNRFHAVETGVLGLQAITLTVDNDSTMTVNRIDNNTFNLGLDMGSTYGVVLAGNNNSNLVVNSIQNNTFNLVNPSSNTGILIVANNATIANINSNTMTLSDVTGTNTAIDIESFDGVMTVNKVENNDINLGNSTASFGLLARASFQNDQFILHNIRFNRINSTSSAGVIMDFSNLAPNSVMTLNNFYGNALHNTTGTYLNFTNTGGPSTINVKVKIDEPSLGISAANGNATFAYFSPAPNVLRVNAVIYQ